MDKTYIKCDKRDCRNNTHYDDASQGWCSLSEIHIMKNGLCLEYHSWRGQRHITQQCSGQETLSEPERKNLISIVDKLIVKIKVIQTL